MFVKLLRNLFKHSKKQEITPQPAAPEKKPRKWWEFPFRLINTSRGGFNMPKYQSCPKCKAGAKRKFKTDYGANYLCRCGNKFAVGRIHRRQVIEVVN